MTHKELSNHVMPYLTTKWREVGLALALTPPQLNDTEENNQGISDVFRYGRILKYVRLHGKHYEVL